MKLTREFFYFEAWKEAKLKIHRLSRENSILKMLNKDAYEEILYLNRIMRLDFIAGLLIGAAAGIAISLLLF